MITKDLTSYVLGGFPHVNRPNRLSKSIDMSSATWNTVASHEVFSVTGSVRFRIIMRCSASLTDGADGAYIQVGIAGDTDLIVPSIGAAGAGGSSVATGNFIYQTAGAGPTGATGLSYSAAMNDLVYYLGGGTDIGYEITGAALTGGTLEFDLYWEPLDSTGNVTIGDGSSL